MSGSQGSPAAAWRRYLLNPVALGYLAVVAAVWVWILVDTLFVEHADASLAGVWGFLITAPTSFLFTGLPGSWLFGGIAVAALFQAAVLGIVYRGIADRVVGAPNAG